MQIPHEILSIYDCIFSKFSEEAEICPVLPLLPEMQTVVRDYHSTMESRQSRLHKKTQCLLIRPCLQTHLQQSLSPKCHTSPQTTSSPPSLPTSPIRRFLTSPTHFLAHWLYTHRPPLAPLSSGSAPIKLVCISDTHNKCPLLPAVNMTINGSLAEVRAQVEWVNTLPHAQKVVIAGNHDVCLAEGEGEGR